MLRPWSKREWAGVLVAPTIRCRSSSFLVNLLRRWPVVGLGPTKDSPYTDFSVMVIFPARIIMLVLLVTLGKIILELYQNYCIHFFQENWKCLPKTFCLLMYQAHVVFMLRSSPHSKKISSKSSPALEANSTNTHHSLARLLSTIHLPELICH